MFCRAEKANQYQSKDSFESNGASAKSATSSNLKKKEVRKKMAIFVRK